FVLFLESFAPLVNSLNLGLAGPFVLGPPPFQLAQIKTHLALRRLSSAASGGPAPPHAGFRHALLKDAMFSPRGTLPPRPRGPNPSGTKPPGTFGAGGAAGPPRKPAPAKPQGAPQRFSAQDALQWTGSQRINVRVTLHRADPRKVKEKSNLHQEQKGDPRANRWDGGPCPAGGAGPKPLVPTPLPQPMLPPVMPPPLVQPPISQHVLPPLTSPPFSAGLLAAISQHERKQRETGSSQPGPGASGRAAAGHKPFHSHAAEPIKSPFGVVKASWLPVFPDSQKSKRLPTPSMMNDYYATSPRIFPHLCSLCNLECTHMK
ncbi:ZN638 protein, partial [Oriolus oriolus]|nr:ZN638 protein [Oriolus oriolus]